MAKISAKRKPTNDRYVSITTTVLIPDLLPKDKTILATPVIEKEVVKWVEAKQERKKSELTEKAKTSLIKEFMQDATALLNASGTALLATYREHPCEKFDEAKFSRDHPKLYKKYLKNEPQRPLKVK